MKKEKILIGVLIFTILMLFGIIFYQQNEIGEISKNLGDIEEKYERMIIETSIITPVNDTNLCMITNPYTDDVYFIRNIRSELINERTNYN